MDIIQAVVGHYPIDKINQDQLLVFGILTSKPSLWCVILSMNRGLGQLHRRKFRSETSDNMDSWKSRGGKSERGEEKKTEDQRGD